MANQINDIPAEVKSFCWNQLNLFVEKTDGENWCKDITNFRIQTLSGGLTNTLYRCWREHSNIDDPQYVLRFFGAGKVNNIQEENIVAAIVGSKRLGPEVYGIFDGLPREENNNKFCLHGGRIEQFIPSETIRTEQLSNSEVNKTVAEMTAELHKLQMPIDKSGNFLTNTMSIYFEKIDLESEEPELREKLLSAYDTTKTILSNTRSPICFCHNDTQPGNTLKPNKSNTNGSNLKLFFIDYEYSAYSYRAFDAGNYFAEWMYDYTAQNDLGFTGIIENYPSISQQEEYAKAYLGPKATVQEIAEFLAEARQFTLVSHCFWSIWCLIQDPAQAPEFDYKAYAHRRLDHFEIQSNQFQQ